MTRCPRLPASCLLSAEHLGGGSSPLLTTSPTGVCFHLLSNALFHPCPRGLQGLHEHLGPPVPSPHGFCLPRGKGTLAEALRAPCLFPWSSNPPPPPHPLSSSHTGLLAVSPINKASSSLRAFASAVSPPERLFSQVPTRLTSVPFSGLYSNDTFLNFRPSLTDSYHQHPLFFFRVLHRIYHQPIFYIIEFSLVYCSTLTACRRSVS